MTSTHPAPPRIVGMDGSALRRAFGDELRAADRLDLAISRIRLDTLGSIPAELMRLAGVRVLLGEVRAERIDAEAHSLVLRPAGRHRVRLLSRLLQEGRAEIRAAPLGSWHPDFSIFTREVGDPRTKALVGSHAFGRIGPGSGPVMAVRLIGEETRALEREFERCWSRAHPVTGAVEGMLRRALRWSGVPRSAFEMDPESAA